MARCVQTPITQLVPSMMSSEDEYANLPDITAGVDLDAIAALCTPAQDDASSEYSFDELDDDTLAEVARIEAQALAAVDTTTAAGNTRRSSRLTPPR